MKSITGSFINYKCYTIYFTILELEPPSIQFKFNINVNGTYVTFTVTKKNNETKNAIVGYFFALTVEIGKANPDLDDRIVSDLLLAVEAIEAIAEFGVEYGPVIALLLA